MAESIGNNTIASRMRRFDNLVRGMGSMGLNASPQPENNGEVYDPHYADEHVDKFQKNHSDHVDLVVSAAEIARREREDRIRERQRSDDHRNYASHSSITDEAYQQQKKHRFNKLPSGWLDCPAFGREIGCIIPSKVPLGESFIDAVGPGKRYSFRQVIHHLRVLSKKLGMVIDLTNTDRYYLKTDLKREGIKHVKIACSGHDSVPDNESVNWFVYEVSQFLARQKPPKKYVLVHCTHGYNRTGYMIVHYLMHSEQITVTQALRRFAEARPPGIYKPDYIDALYSFYHEKKPYMAVCPSTPEWKRSSEFDLNGDSAALPQTSRTVFGNSAMKH